MRITKKYKEVFKLEKENLKKIQVRLKSWLSNEIKKRKDEDIIIGDIDSIIYCDYNREDYNIVLEDIELLINDDNINGKKIETIRLSDNRNRWDSDSSVNVIFEREKDLIEYIIIGSNASDSQDLLNLSKDLDIYIKRAIIPKSRVISSFFEHIEGYLILVLILGVLLLGFTSFPEIDIKIADLRLSQFLIGSTILFAIFIVIFSLILDGSFISRFFAKIETKSVFYWGDQAKIFDKREKKLNLIKNGIIIAFIVSVIASLVASAILKL